MTKRRPLRFWRENHNNNGGLRFTGDSVLLKLNLRYMRVYCSPRSSSSISLLNRTTMATMEAAMVVDVVVVAVVVITMEIEIEIDRWFTSVTSSRGNEHTSTSSSRR